MVAIGITGHRFLMEVDRITIGIDAALARIDAAFKPPFAVVSSLAEGADRLVVRRALARWPDAYLIVVLPLPATDYLQDFESVTSRHAFRRLLARADEVTEVDPAPRPEAYAAAGYAMLARSDVLVAIWDGKGAQGTGGTGAVVGRARADGMPLAWVHAGNRKPGTTTPTTLGAAQGTVTYERFPR